MTPSTVAQANKRIENDKPMADIALVCRDSFHSLIGDLWIAGIQTNFFGGKLSNDHPLSPMFLWDSDIPRPSPYNITAWYLTLEDPLVLSTAWNKVESFVRPPMSIDPYNFNPFDIWNGFEPPVFMGFVPNGIRPNLQNNFAFDYKWQSTFSGGFSSQGFESQCTEIDFTAFLSGKQEELEQLAVTKLALLHHVLTPPGLALTSNTTAYQGIQMRLWASYGIWIYTDESQDQESAPRFAESQVKLTKGGTKILDFVPCCTPRVWFGFTNEHEAFEFMEAYFRLRHLAIDTVQGIRLSPGVTNPEWENTLTKLGSLVESDKAEVSKPSKTKVKADQLSQALAGMTFDL